MRILYIFLALLFSTISLLAIGGQARAQTASQCTTSELDLICPEGQTLRGINTNGTKICVLPAEKEISTRIVSKTKTEYRWPSATASCGSDEVVVGGGGSCSADNGWTFLKRSYPDNNGWNVSCDTPEKKNNTARAYAICMKK